MSNPWDGMSKDPLTDDELRKLRYQMQFVEANDSLIRRAVMIVKSWWLLPAGVLLAVSGALGKLVQLITDKAGM